MTALARTPRARDQRGNQAGNSGARTAPGSGSQRQRTRYSPWALRPAHSSGGELALDSTSGFGGGRTPQEPGRITP
ncbi:hypothetical protein NDU88_005553 [Pleurodeles waltl]|uniref:Uncharacterized protein n=1 Tax=Pleurodeles waltl TaxID=8319 RepID=A0AAV7RPD7_PLEWA|nr:hypothetical protein NDU88_005553 [Pleurodeles waltl]